MQCLIFFGRSQNVDLKMRTLCLCAPVYVNSSVGTFLAQLFRNLSGMRLLCVKVHLVLISPPSVHEKIRQKSTDGCGSP